MVQMYFDRERSGRHHDPEQWEQGQLRKHGLHEADARDRREQNARPVHLLNCFVPDWKKRTRQSRKRTVYRGKPPAIVIERCGLDPREKIELRPDDSVWGKLTSGEWVQLFPLSS